jgi:hypothetical protein
MTTPVIETVLDLPALQQLLASIFEDLGGFLLIHTRI